MSPRILPALILLSSLALSGCGRWAVDREVVWARMGTPACIVDERPVRVLVPDGDGGFLPGQANLVGMVAIDEPTLEYYRRLDAQAQPEGDR